MKFIGDINIGRWLSHSPLAVGTTTFFFNMVSPLNMYCYKFITM